MRTVTRDDVSTPYSRCRDCNCKTSSYVIETAEYEIYKEEVIVGMADENAAEQWEDVEEVEKYDMVIDPVVICHKCWLQKQEEFAKLVKKNSPKWSKDVIVNATAIKRAVNTQVYYEFDNEETVNTLKGLAKQLKEAALDA